MDPVQNALNESLAALARSQALLRAWHDAIAIDVDGV